MGADAEWEDAEVLGGDSPVGQDGAQQPLPLEGADQPQLLIYVFLAYLALYYTMWAARAKNPSESPQARKLQEEIADSKAQLKLLDPVKDFVAVSKVQRRMIKTEKALAALTGDTGDASDGGTPLAAVLKLCGGAMAEVLFSTALVFWYWSTPVIVVPSHWVLPLGLWGTMFRAERSVSIGVVLWVTVTGRVAKRLFNWAHPTANPGMDYASIRKSIIGF